MLSWYRAFTILVPRTRNRSTAHTLSQYRATRYLGTAVHRALQRRRTGSGASEAKSIALSCIPGTKRAETATERD
eukprot:86369-Rhodomonas_salina.1